eukprot:scaffold323733_cov31-Tisochrysis_lutea.AAC.2
MRAEHVSQALANLHPLRALQTHNARGGRLNRSAGRWRQTWAPAASERRPFVATRPRSRAHGDNCLLPPIESSRSPCGVTSKAALSALPPPRVCATEREPLGAVDEPACGRVTSAVIVPTRDGGSPGPALTPCMYSIAYLLPPYAPGRPQTWAPTSTCDVSPNGWRPVTISADS